MYAAKTYLKEHPAPTTLEEIADHAIIVYGETAVPEIRDINWLLEAFKKNAKPGGKGRIIRINNITGILQATEAGLGIGVVPDYVAAQHPSLERVLPEVAARASTCTWSMPTPCAIQARGGVPRFCGQVVQGLAVLRRAGRRRGRRGHHGWGNDDALALDLQRVHHRTVAGGQDADAQHDRPRRSPA